MAEYTHIQHWTRPQFYAGASWPDYYSAGVGQTRDSDALARSNFRSMLHALGGESDTVRVIREGHFLCGWVEWIAIHESDDRALAIADGIAEALEDYPVIDEDDWSSLEYEEACAYWESMSVSERLRYIQEARDRTESHMSIFAARRAELPEDPAGRLYEALTRS